MHPNLLFVFLLCAAATRAQAELSGLLSALHYFGLYSNGTSDSLGISRGQCHYSFETFALLEERRTCAPDDEHILHLTQLAPPVRKPPMMIKCLQQEPPPENETSPEPGLLIMHSAKEIVSLLKPVGNATKRHEPGSCVVVHFCTASSLECARVAPMMNLLPHFFPTLPIAYVDAYEFGRFNAEFGIVSLPTLMIFHQGRPLIKYDPSWSDSEKRSFARFIMRHTNVKTVDPQAIHPDVFNRTRREPLSNVPIVQTDYYLVLAWAFILACLANYLRQTVFWKQLVEMVQRNWRESEETQMEMVD
ncbi:thioredoxin domain-containing protein 15 [Drosophila takahashii]|uniref:thioredoxin domain-containing protein 15 n=1 Tax=Drosophila takahashii TaxID=29030 RepID=UPI001CF82AFF|nr:thioredoxin domain-containing protein 15 [Drosophila takahashii]